jgi:flagellar biosynthesis/type III secretory pathway protein FliH
MYLSRMKAMPNERQKFPENVSPLLTQGSTKKTTKSRTARGNVIKLSSGQSSLKIADYKNILEEISADKQTEGPSPLKRVFSSTDCAETDRHNGATQFPPNNQNESEKDKVAEAYENGFEAGKTEAAKIMKAEYEKKINESLKYFSSMVQEFSKEVERYNREFDAAVVKLALAIAKRIVAQEVGVDEGAVLARSREALRKIIGVDKIKIHVNPSDEEYIRGHRNELMAYADSVKEITIEGDSKVDRGGCIIESDLGNIDARISTQFELVEEALLGLANR